MCSNPADEGPPADPADLAVRLRRLIDELASAGTTQDAATSSEFTEQLARAWAIIAAADPELAERAARYG